MDKRDSSKEREEFFSGLIDENAISAYLAIEDSSKEIASNIAQMRAPQAHLSTRELAMQAQLDLNEARARVTEERDEWLRTLNYPTLLRLASHLGAGGPKEAGAKKNDPVAGPVVRRLREIVDEECEEWRSIRTSEQDASLNKAGASGRPPLPTDLITALRFSTGDKRTKSRVLEWAFYEYNHVYRMCRQELSATEGSFAAHIAIVLQDFHPGQTFYDHDRVPESYSSLWATPDIVSSVEQLTWFCDQFAPFWAERSAQYRSLAKEAAASKRDSRQRARRAVAARIRPLLLARTEALLIFAKSSGQSLTKNELLQLIPRFFSEEAPKIKRLKLGDSRSKEKWTEFFCSLCTKADVTWEQAGLMEIMKGSARLKTSREKPATRFERIDEQTVYEVHRLLSNAING